MDSKRLVKISKYLSKHLRHEPERLGLVLQPGGWVNVADLLAACAAHHFAISHTELLEVLRSRPTHAVSRCANSAATPKGEEAA